MKTIKDTASSAAAPLSSEVAAAATITAVPVIELAVPTVREHPPLPGGGSWTFNEETWQWDSNDPVAPADAPAAVPTTAEE